MTVLTLIGRSSSHFTRTARIFALELGVAHSFRPVLDITSLDAADYDNPALKVPTLVDDGGPLFGTENICRALALRSSLRDQVVLRGDVIDRAVANAEELTLHVMANEVTLLMAKMAGDERLIPPKLRRSIENSLTHLNDNFDRTLAALPAERRLSFLETALFCMITHLPFRELMDVSGYARLQAFSRQFAEHLGAQQTAYRFDAA